MSQMLII